MRAFPSAVENHLTASSSAIRAQVRASRQPRRKEEENECCELQIDLNENAADGDDSSSSSSSMVKADETKLMLPTTTTATTTAGGGGGGGDVCWKATKRVSYLLILAWLLYVGVLLYSLHPCPSSSKCLAALITGYARDTVRLASHVPGSQPPQPSSSSSSSSSWSTGPTDLHHIAFGIASSADEWPSRRTYVETWWDSSRMRGFVWLDRQVNMSMSMSSSSSSSSSSSLPPTRIQEDTSRFKFTHPFGPRSAIRVARVVAEMVRLRLRDVRWYFLGDDDTFVVPDNLVRVLASYNHSRFFYIGTNSETVDQNNMHSYAMAYGGGGIAMSAALAEALAATLDSCLDRYAHFYGSDERIHACVAELGVPLTRQAGFHQTDLRGDIFGVLAAHPVGAPFVTLHHLDSVQPLFPGLSRADSLRHLTMAAKADPSRVVQQSLCYDRLRNWTVVASWGYSVQVWQSVLLPQVVEKPMRTFFSWTDYDRSGRVGFVFNTRPMPGDLCHRPRILFMDHVVSSSSSSDGIIISRYARHDNFCPNSDSSSLRKVTVYSRRKPDSDWDRAPRKDCCDVVSQTKETMEVVVRSCTDGESVLPPA